MLSGAQFIVSPHFDPEIRVICNRYRCPYIAGVMRPVTEAISAMDAGVDILKLFPGSGAVVYQGVARSAAAGTDLCRLAVQQDMLYWIKSGAVAIGVWQ